jgi:hypothetical protein
MTTLQGKHDDLLAFQSHWHQVDMPKQRSADEKDPETYPEQPRMDAVEAVEFIPMMSSYYAYGKCHLALLWTRSGSIEQKDVMTVELDIENLHAKCNAPKEDMLSASPTLDTMAARIGPWMLLYAHHLHCRFAGCTGDLMLE